MGKHDRETRYESVLEVHELVVDRIPQRQAEPRAASVSTGNGHEWTLGASLQDAADLFLKGWDQHTETVSDNVQRELEKLQDKVNKFNDDQTFSLLDVAGGWVDVDRYISGEPECMWEQQVNPAVVNGRVLRVLVNGAAACNVDADALVTRGTAVVSAVQAVQAMGFNVELWVGESVSPTGNAGDNSRNVEMVKVKDYRDPIDIDVSMFCMAHPAMLRRIFFLLNEEHDDNHRRAFGFGVGTGGYGSPSEFPKELTEQFDFVVEQYRWGQEKNAESIIESMIFTNDEERISEYE